MDNKRSLFQRLALPHCPPGASLGSLEGSFWGGFGLILGTALPLAFSLVSNIQTLGKFREKYPVDWSIDDMSQYQMPTMDSFFTAIFYIGLLTVCLLLAHVAFHYLYFRQESRSDYVMHRISDPRELHRRCWTVPLVCCGFILLEELVLYALLCWAYFSFSPEGSIPAQYIALFWRYVP